MDLKQIWEYLRACFYTLFNDPFEDTMEQISDESERPTVHLSRHMSSSVHGIKGTIDIGGESFCCLEPLSHIASLPVGVYSLVRPANQGNDIFGVYLIADDKEQIVANFGHSTFHPKEGIILIGKSYKDIKYPKNTKTIMIGSENEYTHFSYALNRFKPEVLIIDEVKTVNLEGDTQ